MIRIASSCSVCQTITTLCRFDMPVVKNRSSVTECSESGTVVASASPKTELASSKETPCLARFAAAFSGCHSNRTLEAYHEARFLPNPTRDPSASSRDLIGVELHDESRKQTVPLRA